MIATFKTLISFILLFFVIAVVMAEDYSLQVVDNNGKGIGFLNIQENKGVEYVFLEEISRLFGGTRKYEPLIKRVTLNMMDKKVIFTIERSQVKIGDEEYSLSKPVITISDKTAVPTEFLTKVLPIIIGRKVSIDWESERLRIGKENSDRKSKEEPNPADIRQYSVSGLRVIIDPGHGGYEVGAKSKTGLLEKDLNLNVALKMKELLAEKDGVEVFLTREEDKYMSQEERINFANDLRGDVFLTIHFNWSPSQNSKGCCIFVNNSKIHIDSVLSAGAPRDSFSSQSRKFASEIKSRLDNLISTGIKYVEAPLVSIDGIFMPGVLVEIAYLSSSDDLDIIAEGDFFDSVSLALCDSILSFGSNIKFQTNSVSRE